MMDGMDDGDSGAPLEVMDRLIAASGLPAPVSVQTIDSDGNGLDNRLMRAELTDGRMVVMRQSRVATTSPRRRVAFLRANGIKCRKLKNLSEGSEDSLNSIRSGYVSYISNTRALLSGVHYINGAAMRRCAVENGVTLFTSLDTVRMVLDVLEENINPVSTIDEE